MCVGGRDNLLRVTPRTYYMTLDVDIPREADIPKREESILMANGRHPLMDLHCTLLLRPATAQSFQLWLAGGFGTMVGKSVGALLGPAYKIHPSYPPACNVSSRG